MCLVRRCTPYETHPAILGLSFGQLETVTHSEGGAIGSAVNLVATASEDVDFSASLDWEPMRLLTESERSQHLALEAEREAA